MDFMDFTMPWINVHPIYGYLKKGWYHKKKKVSDEMTQKDEYPPGTFFINHVDSNSY